MTDQPTQSKRDVVEEELRDKYVGYESRILSIVKELERENGELRFQADVLGNEKPTMLSAEMREIIWDSVPEPQHSGMIQSPTVVLEYALEWMKKAKAELATLRAQGEKTCEWKWVAVMQSYASECGPMNSIVWHKQRTEVDVRPYCDACGKLIQSTALRREDGDTLD